MKFSPPVAFAFLCAIFAWAQSTAGPPSPAPVVPLTAEAPSKLVIDPPLSGPLAIGRVVIQYRAENLRILPVFGPAALAVSPRIGHIHVNVDSAPWRWADASGEPLILNGFPPGPHKILIELVSPDHRVLDAGSVTFVIPKATKQAGVH